MVRSFRFGMPLNAAEPVGILTATLTEPAMTAADYGRDAFHNGINAPCLDRAFMERYCLPGVPVGGNGGAFLQAMKEWSRAWHAANLAAPVPE